MKNYVLNSHLFIVLFFALILTTFGCSSNSGTTTDIDSTVDIIKKDTVNIEEVGAVPAIFNVPVKIAEENSREIVEDSLLQIMFVDSNVAMGKQQELMKQMFPGAVIQSAEASEEFEAYNINYNNSNYHVVVLFEQNDKEEYIVGFFIVADGKFTLETIGKIFN